MKSFKEFTEELNEAKSFVENDIYKIGDYIETQLNNKSTIKMVRKDSSKGAEYPFSKSTIYVVFTPEYGEDSYFKIEMQPDINKKVFLILKNSSKIVSNSGNPLGKTLFSKQSVRTNKIKVEKTFEDGNLNKIYKVIDNFMNKIK